MALSCDRPLTHKPNDADMQTQSRLNTTFV